MNNYKNKSIVICSNYAWTIYNFRMSLIKSLNRSGYKVIVITQFDGYEKKIAKEVDQIILKGAITIPHERMQERNFVLIPLHELDKKWFHPKTNENIGKLIFSLPIKDITSIKKI